MPPKPKFTREEIVAAALDLVSERGMRALTSRDLAARLGSSPRPIFTVFKNMDELQDEVRNAALRRFEEFAKKPSDYKPEFKRFGMQMIHFAIEEPKLYQLLYMTESGVPKSFDDLFARLGGVAETSIGVIEADYGLTSEEAKLLFRQMWIYTFGIGALCAAGACSFAEEGISEMLSRAFLGTMMLLKSGKQGE